ncbi:FxLD family lanthipeptide [Actinomadura sp. SCN-SB]|uniref:FxLD family lanthipeptide n=1 Tax=Actinomadura sp. SCN-SB TaxID=3373092 RepID=UPI003751DBCE
MTASAPVLAPEPATDPVLDPGGVAVDEFDLDLRVVEAAYPIAKLMCDTGDGCGSSCSGSACNTAANDPF